MVPLKRLETIENEIKDLKRKAAVNILEIGDRLIEAKELLNYGEWEPWLTNNVGFSARTARNIMKAARIFKGEERQALADLDITKLYYLSELPDEQRAELIENNNILDITTRELKTLISDGKTDISAGETDISSFALPVDEWAAIKDRLEKANDLVGLSRWTAFLKYAQCEVDAMLAELELKIAFAPEG